MKKFDLAVIGAGPGGYVAALRATQKGMRVVCIEKESTLGGTCLNVGCIPSKALLYSTEYYYKIASEGKEHGIEVGDLKVNLAHIMERKNKIVAKLNGGISYLFNKQEVTSIRGEARLINPNLIEVGDEKVEATHILLATGSEPISLPQLPFDEKKILSSTGALALDYIPEKMLLVGAGVIGLELGSVYNRLGSRIEVIELLDRVAPTLDQEISKGILHMLQKQGFSFRLSTKVKEGKIENGKVKLLLDKGEVSGDVVLVAIGRRPYFKGLGLKELGIAQDLQGRVMIDQNFRTSIPNIYAIGDLVDGPMLAHKASSEGMAVVDLIAGEDVEINYQTIPNVMYTWPEVASLGMTEEECLRANLEIMVGRVSFKSIPRALCSGDLEGFVKIIGEKKNGRLLGLHIIGPSASEIIHEGVIAIEKKMTLTEIAHASHAHPSCAEAIKEAALAAMGQAIHL